MIPKSGYRFSLATNASACAEIIRNSKMRMIPILASPDDGGVPRSKKA
ncbi:hypothetical protein ABIB82_004563 [Bradyrhizobium sp. i1.8.4]